MDCVVGLLMFTAGMASNINVYVLPLAPRKSWWDVDDKRTCLFSHFTCHIDGESHDLSVY